MRAFWFELAALGWALGRSALSNRGLIPFGGPAIKVFEPKQRALIAWNGEEEMLVLSTDLRASQPTQVLEVMPLPAEPKVEKGHPRVFQRLWYAYQAKLAGSRYPESKGAGLTRDMGMLGGDLPPAGQVTFHERIGAHDISVTQALRKEGFIEWVESYLRQAGVEKPDLSPEMEAIIGRYIARGYAWFVFDAVSLGTELRSNDALRYVFPSTRLFYPLEITSTGEGDTEIELMVLTPEPLKYFPELPHYRIKLDAEIVEISRYELEMISKDLGQLMKGASRFRLWKISGNLAAFRQDLIATNDLPVWRRVLQGAADK